MELVLAALVMFFLTGGGFITLAKGRIQASRTSVVEGVPAMFVGMLLLLSVPISIAAFVYSSAILRWFGADAGPESYGPLLVVCIPLLGCPLLAVIVGFCTARQIDRPDVAPDRAAHFREDNEMVLPAAPEVVDHLSPSGEGANLEAESIGATPSPTVESIVGQPEVPYPGIKGALGLMLVLAIGTGICLVPVLGGVRNRDFQSRAGLLLAVNGIATIGIAIAIALKLFGGQARRMLALRPFAMFHLLLTVLLVPALALFAIGVVNWAVPQASVQEVPDLTNFEFRPKPAAVNWSFREQVYGELSTRPWLVILLLGCVLPAIGEEIFFRGILGRGLVARYGLVPGMLITSVLFGIMHLEPANVIAATLLGLACHVLFLTSKSLFASILLHTLNNFLMFSAMKFEELAATVIPGVDGRVPFLLWLTALGAVVGLFVLFYQSRVRWMLPDGLPWQPGYLTAEMPDAHLSADPRRTTPRLRTGAFALAGYAAFAGLLVFQSGLNPASVHAGFSRGTAAYERGDYDDAITEYTAAINADPLCAWVYNARGMALTMIGRAGEAIADFTEAIRLDEKTASYWANRAWAFNQCAEFDRAIEDCNRAIRLDSRDHFALFNRGKAQSSLGKTDPALKDFDRAIRLNSKDVWGFQLRADVLFGKREYEKALDDYESALKIDPSDVHCKTQRDYIVEHRELLEGNAQYIKGDFRAAIAIYDRVLRDKPTEPTALANRGMARVNIGDFAAAITDLDLVAQNRPPDDPARVSRTIAYFNTGRLIDVKSDCDEAVELMAKDPARALRYAEKLIGNSIWAAALPVLDRAAAENRESSAILAARGRVLSNLHRYDRAAADFEAALRLTPAFHQVT